MEAAWLCVVLSRSLCEKGIDVVRHEIKRMTGDSFVDFHLVDDGFESDCYSFVKCRKMGNYLEKFRASRHVVSVLDSYDSPAYLSDDEVGAFIHDEQKKETGKFSFGDMVLVEGDGIFSKLKGVVVGMSDERSLVLFQFHTVSMREWLSNDELVNQGSVFTKIKFPVITSKRKFPVIKESGDVNSCKRNRSSDREDKQDGL